MRLVLKLKVGNAAMEDYGDLGYALKALGRDFIGMYQGDRAPHIKDGNSILDDNGNSVGSWGFENE